MYLADDFRPLLDGQDLGALARTLTPVFGVRDDLSIAYRNDAWAAVTSADDALEGHPGDGRPLLDVVARPLRGHVDTLFAVARETRRPAELHVERPSPTRRRLYRLRALPLREGATLGVLQRVEERPHRDLACPPDPYKYAASGIVSQCAACRRTRRVASPSVWDWVPAYVRRGPVTIQPLLCPTCDNVLRGAVDALRGAAAGLSAPASP